MPVDRDISDAEFLDFALGFAGLRPAHPVASRLLAEFGDVDVILATDPDALIVRGGLSGRAAAVLKLVNAFRHDNRRALLH